MSRRSAPWSRSSAGLTLAAACAVLAAATVLHGGCLVTEHCYSQADCTAPLLCLPDGTCGFQCTVDADCGAGMGCVGHRCRPKFTAPIECPSDMVNIAEAFCIDRFEASRPDATATSNGTQSDKAMSRPGVMPWQLFGAEGNETARSACVSAGKELCTPQQWQSACEGRAGTAYGYGDIYEPATCNGIDTYGLSGFHLLPTGSLPRCRSDWGVYDINGNLWEHTLHGSDRTIRGGAYNCKDSQTLHRCDYIPGDWEPTARGFRCCLVPTPDGDAGTDAEVSTEASLDVTSETEVGCLDPDVVDSSQEAPSDVSLDSTDTGSEASSDAPPDAPPDTPEDTSSDTSIQGCPDDMVRIQHGGLDFCMDVYEAAHVDATAVSQGMLPMAVSRAGVQPWQWVDLETARSGCLNSGKRLCRLDEWVKGCSGPSGMVYGYGNTYDPDICNGIDTYCNCGSGTCSGLNTCPYPHCFNQASSEGGGPCGATLHVEVTGAFPDCHSPWGVFDINGNVWELADTDDGLEHFRGGAFNCTDTEALHRCDHDGTWGPSARGFRCCKDPE